MGLNNSLNAGIYYIFYTHDAINQHAETNETDNTSFVVLQIDSTSTIPFIDDFETNSVYTWKDYFKTGFKGGFIDVWEHGYGYDHHLEGARSGVFAWHTSITGQIDIQGSNTNTQYVESPPINLLDTSSSVVLSFWRKVIYSNSGSHISPYFIEYSNDCKKTWTFLNSITQSQNDDWGFVNITIDSLLGNDNVSFRIVSRNGSPTWEGISIDDFYVGHQLADLSIMGNKENRFTSTNTANLNLRYNLVNAGTVASGSFNVYFFWSVDSLLDSTDILLGVKQESISQSNSVFSSFSFTKPSIASGKYYVFYVLDGDSVVPEMREYDNIRHFEIFQSSTHALP